MKRLSFLSVLFFAAILTLGIGCGDDDDDDNNGVVTDAGDQDAGDQDAGDLDADDQDADDQDADDQDADDQDADDQDAGETGIIDADLPEQPDTGDADQPADDGLSTGVDEGRSADDLSAGERDQVCGAISEFVGTSIDEDIRVEAECRRRAISFASFQVVDGDNDRLRSVCHDFYDDCVDDPPEEAFVPLVSVEPTECAVVENCPASVGEIESCIEGLMAFLGEREANAATCDEIAFTPVGQVVTTNDFQPNFDLLAPCEQLSQQCELDAPIQ